MEHGGYVGHIGDGVALSGNNSFNLREECFVLLAFATSAYFKKETHFSYLRKARL